VVSGVFAGRMVLVRGRGAKIVTRWWMEVSECLVLVDEKILEVMDRLVRHVTSIR
jgi:hypothetical protein